MDFKKKLRIRLYMAIAYIITGIVFAALFFRSTNEYMMTLGIALIIMGIFRIIRYMKITKDDDSVRLQKIAETDERNISIIHKAKSTAFGLYILITAMAVIVLEILGNSELSSILGLNVCIIVFLYWICYRIYQKKL